MKIIHLLIKEFLPVVKNDNCPPWSIQSKKIEHDKIKKTLKYDNAILKIYDIPVFYFPKFFIQIHLLKDNLDC